MLYYVFNVTHIEDIIIDLWHKCRRFPRISSHWVLPHRRADALAPQAKRHALLLKYNATHVGPRSERAHITQRKQTDFLESI